MIRPKTVAFGFLLLSLAYVYIVWDPEKGLPDEEDITEEFYW